MRLATYLSIVNSPLPPPLHVRLTLHTNAHTQISSYTHIRALFLIRHLSVRSFGLGRICPHSQPPRCARQRCGYVETSPRRHVAHSVCHRPSLVSDFRLAISGFRFSVGLAVSRPRRLAPGGLPQSKSARARCTKASLGAGICEEDETLAVVSRVDRDWNGRRVFESIVRNS